MILFSCEHATERMTDHLEGALPWPKRLAMWAHLAMCRACRAFLRSLREVPLLAREAFQEPLADPPAGHAMLDKALGRIQAGEGRGPRLHPDASQWRALEEGRADLPARLLLELHLGACAACRGTHPGHVSHPLPARSGDGVPPLPESLRAQLPDPGAWTWHNHLLNGSRSAKVWEDRATGVDFWLAFVPEGRSFPGHRHTGQEAAVPLTGWVRDGLDLAGPGDFVQHEAGTRHAPSSTNADGCWFLARVGPGGLRFSGWRRIFG
jgi:anti-sigma factor ChrR (cupin superfamily)